MRKLMAILLCTVIGCTATGPTPGTVVDELGVGLGSGAPPPPPPPDPAPSPDAGSGPVSDGGCTGASCGEDCSTFYTVDAPPAGEPTDTPALKAPIAQQAGEPYTIEILADGTGNILNSAGEIVQTVPKMATPTSGGWVIRPEMVPKWLKGLRVAARFARCIGPIAALMLISDLANAGMNVSLGGAAAAIGIRTQDCIDRFNKAAGGLACLNRQTAATTCAQAVANCPDAFFGANLVSACAGEAAMNPLIDALVAAIQMTAARVGGAGSIVPDIAGLIADAIRQGKFATNPAMTCSLRSLVKDCKFTPGDLFPAPAGWDEAKKCWDDAWRGIGESKWEEANKCCTTAACRGLLVGMKDC